VRPDFWVVQTFNGVSYGALLFLLSSGLSLIFGVMRIVNMAHGSYFMLGGYLGLTVALRTRSFAMAVLAGTVAIGTVVVGSSRIMDGRPGDK
jgi:branched-chain amino acid transport system permease protein